MALCGPGSALPQGYFGAPCPSLQPTHPKRGRQPELLRRAASKCPKTAPPATAPPATGRPNRAAHESQLDDPQPDLTGVQPRPLHRASGRRLLRRDLHVRMVSRRANPPLERSGSLAPADAAAHASEPIEHAGRPRLLRRLGAVPESFWWAILSGLHGREALRPCGARRQCVVARYAQLRGDQPKHRGALVRPCVPEQQRLRSVTVPRRRWQEVPRQHALGPPPPLQPFRRHPAAGVLGSGKEAGRQAPRHLRRHELGFHRSPPSVSAQGVLSSAHGGGRHRLGPRGDHGPVAPSGGPVRAAPGRAHPLIP